MMNQKKNEKIIYIKTTGEKILFFANSLKETGSHFCYTDNLGRYHMTRKNKAVILDNLAALEEYEANH